MFVLAILIGIYSYIILALGFAGILYANNISLLTFVFLAIILFFYREHIWIKLSTFNLFIKSTVRNKNLLILLLLFLTQASVNIIGVLGPEISFDSLWYHLTLPKIYLQNHEITFIPGSLYYYSTMPKLTEMLYIPFLTLDTETLAKLAHFSFGILSAVVVYKIAREFLSKEYSFLSALLFYGNLVVGWISISAYIDLSRTFFESLAFLSFLFWAKTKRNYFLVTSGLMLGLAVSSKLLALGSLLVYVPLILTQTEKVGVFLRKSTSFIFLTLFLSLPWFVFSFVHTGSPIYPFLSNTYPIEIERSLFSLPSVSETLKSTFLFGQDPILPMYLILFPLVLVYFQKFKNLEKILLYYSLGALLVWYITPSSGGGRFILPYLPALSVVSILTIQKLSDKKLRKYLVALLIVSLVISIGYRFLANSKFLNYLSGQESKNEFLSKNLNFSFGDFYDTDGFFKDNIKKDQTVLLFGFHNLYYADFRFIHSSFVKKGDRFSFVATQNTDLPDRFRYWNLIYTNPKTNVKVYTLGGIPWTY